ncbi:MAG: nuclear transport factor 2 family protein [Candidatus Dadabacteria bacterium]
MNDTKTIFPTPERVKSSELTEYQKQSIKNEVETIVRNYLDAETLSFETEAAIRANVDGYVMAGDGKIMFTDYPSFKEYVKQAFADIQKFTEFNVLSMHTYVLCPEAASCSFDFTGKYLTTKGDTVIHNGCWTMVFKKFDNGWKAVQENGTHVKGD